MFETEFTLKQHTPILHFLPEQHNATLRATELKPKLDRFILEKENGNILDDWIISEHDSHKALDYKLRIQPTGTKAKPLCLINKQEAKTAPFPQVLANVGVKVEDAKELHFYYKTHLVTITTWHEGLQVLINKHLPSLLAQTTFGNRGSKGFGSFSCVKVGPDNINVVPPLDYYFDWRPPVKYDEKGNKLQGGDLEKHRQESLFNAINNFYRCIRSGINQIGRDKKTELYFKSLLWVYTHQEYGNEKWDKYNIKNHFFENGPLSEHPRDFRDWLGLSTDETWRVKKGSEEHPYLEKYKINKESLNPDVERFPSSILFKPEWDEKDTGLCRVYFGVHLKEETAQSFKGSKIKVTCEKSDEGHQTKSSDFNDTPLELTVSREFDVHKFLEFVFEYRKKIDAHVSSGNVSGNPLKHWLHKDYISPIFNNLYQNPAANHGK